MHLSGNSDTQKPLVKDKEWYVCVVSYLAY